MISRREPRLAALFAFYSRGGSASARPALNCGFTAKPVFSLSISSLLASNSRGGPTRGPRFSETRGRDGLCARRQELPTTQRTNSRPKNRQPEPAMQAPAPVGPTLLKGFASKHRSAWLNSSPGPCVGRRRSGINSVASGALQSDRSRPAASRHLIWAAPSSCSSASPATDRTVVDNSTMTPDEEYEFYGRPENQIPQGPPRRRKEPPPNPILPDDFDEEEHFRRYRL